MMVSNGFKCVPQEAILFMIEPGDLLCIAKISGLYDGDESKYVYDHCKRSVGIIDLSDVALMIAWHDAEWRIQILSKHGVGFVTPNRITKL